MEQRKQQLKDGRVLLIREVVVEDARALLDHKGFVIEGTIHKEILFNGSYFDHYWMGLEL